MAVAFMTELKGRRCRLLVQLSLVCFFNAPLLAIVRLFSMLNHLVHALLATSSLKLLPSLLLFNPSLYLECHFKDGLCVTGAEQLIQQCEIDERKVTVANYAARSNFYTPKMTIC